MRWRHHEPLFWALFGAGGMLAAVAMPAVIVVVGVLWPLGVGGGSHAQVVAVVGNPVGRVLGALLLSLVLWHGAHRIRHGMHDLGLHPGPVARALTYGLALAATGGLVVLALAL